jgi:hypothetical protein
MAFQVHYYEEEDFSDAESDFSFDSHSSDESVCLCEDCLGAIVPKPVWSPVVPYRDGDVARLRKNALAFIMKARWRQRFKLLALPAEVRGMILRELLDQEKPLDFHTLGTDSRNFTFHTQILATCQQLYKEGFTILMQQNTFMIHLFGDEHHSDHMRWMEFFTSPSINPRMERLAEFERIRKLEVSIFFEDCGEHLPLVEAASGHRLLVYNFVDKVLSRKKRLSSLKIICDFCFLTDDAPFEPYCLDGITNETVGDDEPSTIEQYILEPLANLRAATDELKLSALPAGCGYFLKGRMESIEQYQCDQQLRLAMVDSHQHDSDEAENRVNEHPSSNTTTA